MRYVLGASMFVRRAAVEACGPMCEDYFLYFEEIDWAERMVGRYRLAVAMDAVVWHKEGGTIGSSTHGRPSDTSLYYLQASLLRFYWRRHRLLMPVAMARTLREVLGLAKQRDWRGCLVIRTALTDVLMKRPRRGRYGSEEFERMA
jgi:GT2 family glycosyltransferase